MTEAEWLSITDPTPMMEFCRGTMSNRKQRLFALACCRTIWPAIPDGFRDAIRVAEAHADGRATDAELGAAVSAVHRVRGKRNVLNRAVYDAARSSGDALGVAKDIARVVARVAAPHPSPTAIGRVVDGESRIEDIPPNADRLLWNAAFASHLCEESSLLRDIVGPFPFRLIKLEAGVLPRNDSTVVKLAQHIYEERAFGNLPILADALEDADCTNPDILAHCRQPGTHVRGCWVLDLLLGKE